MALVEHFLIEGLEMIKPGVAMLGKPDSLFLQRFSKVWLLKVIQQ